MPELFQKERLQPCLLDRLKDNEPKKKTESKHWVLSFQDFKESVERDLEWLLNTGHLESTQDLSGYPNVQESVLNFGMPDFAGKPASSVDSTTLELALRQTIKNFEPRILKKSLKVREITKGERKHNTIILEIQGEVWAHPMPERLYLKTTLDLERGNVEVTLER
jgi:type VI secretion system protein ImpF